MKSTIDSTHVSPDLNSSCDNLSYEMTINDSKLYPTNLSISHIKFTRTITHGIAFMTAFTVAVILDGFQRNAMMELFMEDVMKKKSHGVAN